MDTTEITIIGAGRIGTALSKSPLPNRLLKRNDRNLAAQGPIILCTRNDDLAEILEWIPLERHSDIVLIQNGMLQSWLKEQGLSHVTQALLYIAVSQVGDCAIDGNRSSVTGPHADIFLQLMQSLHLKCQKVSHAVFLTEMVEKFLWNCCFGLLSQSCGCSVGDVVTQHQELCHSLILEQITVCDQVFDLQLSSKEKTAMLERLCEYSLSIYNYQGAVKEWHWRNGWLVTQASNNLHAGILKDTVPELWSGLAPKA